MVMVLKEGCNVSSVGSRRDRIRLVKLLCETLETRCGRPFGDTNETRKQREGIRTQLLSRVTREQKALPPTPDTSDRSRFTSIHGLYLQFYLRALLLSEVTL
jgi:hypothetical protein